MKLLPPNSRHSQNDGTKVNFFRSSTQAQPPQLPPELQDERAQLFSAILGDGEPRTHRSPRPPSIPIFWSALSGSAAREGREAPPAASPAQPRPRPALPVIPPAPATTQALPAAPFPRPLPGQPTSPSRAGRGRRRTCCPAAGLGPAPLRGAPPLSPPHGPQRPPQLTRQPTSPRHHRRLLLCRQPEPRLWAAAAPGVAALAAAEPRAERRPPPSFRPAGRHLPLLGGKCATERPPRTRRPRPHGS